jgi:hypothetical protein
MPLPLPEHGGSLERDLRPLLNAADGQTWVLLQAWLLGTMMPGGDYTILDTHGRPGSGKTHTTMFLKRVVDDEGPFEPTRPNDIETLLLRGERCWVPMFGNLSSISSEMSDTLCQFATGVSRTKRKNYSDDEEVRFAYRRPLALNGVPQLGVKPDFLRRLLLVELPKLASHSPDEEMEARFAEKRPYILGALLDAVSQALARRQAVPRQSLPSMADFYVWSLAGGDGLLWEAGAFQAAYAANQERLTSLAQEASPYIRAIVALLAARSEPWVGRASDLLAALDRDCFVSPKERNGKGWPIDPRQASAWLNLAAEPFEQLGITCESRNTSNGTVFTLTSADMAKKAEEQAAQSRRWDAMNRAEAARNDAFRRVNPDFKQTGVKHEVTPDDYNDEEWAAIVDDAEEEVA